MKKVRTEGTVTDKTVEMVSLKECFETLSVAVDVSLIEWSGQPTWPGLAALNMLSKTHPLPTRASTSQNRHRSCGFN